MSETPPEHIEKMDWRIQGLTWITQPARDPATGRTIPAGAAMTVVALMKYKKQRIGTAIPNATALFLNLSHAFHLEATSLLQKCIADQDEFGKLPDDESFGFFERMMGSVVFACTALEAFVNEQIPDAYTYIEAEKRFTRTYDKEQIERQLSLDTKLGEVLPLALSVKSIKGGKLWGTFIRLRELRDRIIQLKTKDREFIGGEDATSIWNALLSDPLPETHITAKRIIEHFVTAKGNPPRWFQKCAF